MALSRTAKEAGTAEAAIGAQRDDAADLMVNQWLVGDTGLEPVTSCMSSVSA
jgi:hypothetical protein